MSIGILGVQDRLTRDDFEEFKQDYDIYGSHTSVDEYGNEQSVMDESPKCTVRTMWHPVTDWMTAQAYGDRVANMLYAVIYDNPGIVHGDRVTVRGEEYAVLSIKHYQTHDNVEIEKVGA